MTDPLQSPVNTLLVAEDDPVSAAFLREALGTLGLACVVAADGMAALAAARRERFAALVLDLHLPGHGGVEILMSVREDPAAASRQVPALALTAELDAPRETGLRAAGFDAVGAKPLSIARFAALLRELGLDVGAAPMSEPGALPLWDDARARSAVGGQHGIVARLRALMLAELPRQRRALATAFAIGDTDAARAELHRLRASCGFCGALALDAAILQWQGEADAGQLGHDAAHRVIDAIDALLATRREG